MSLFSNRALAALSAPTVNAAVGVCFRFDSGREYYLRSPDTRIDPNGVEWKAGSNIANIDGLQLGVGRRTQPVTITAAGLPGSKWVRLAKEQANSVRGRRIEFFLHLFDANWKYVEAPESLGVYDMDKLVVSYEGDSQMAKVTLNCEPIGISKFRAPNGYLDNRDQQRRYPGDTALAKMGKYVVNQTLPAW